MIHCVPINSVLFNFLGIWIRPKGQLLTDQQEYPPALWKTKPRWSSVWRVDLWFGLSHLEWWWQQTSHSSLIQNVAVSWGAPSQPELTSVQSWPGYVTGASGIHICHLRKPELTSVQSWPGYVTGASGIHICHLRKEESSFRVLLCSWWASLSGRDSGLGALVWADWGGVWRQLPQATA